MRLILSQGGRKKTFPLEDGENVIGRSRTCEVFLRDGSLSKQHAMVVCDGGLLEVSDNGSRNGTFVNGEPLEGDDVQVAYDGDVIQCGKLKFKVQGADKRPDPGAPETLPPILVRVDDPKERWTLEEDEGPYGIGSRSQNQIRLRAEGVSRFHAQLVRKGGVWIVRDLGSRNGVFVNDEAADEHELSPGDVLRIGVVDLRYEQPEPTPVAELAKVFQDPRVKLALAILVVGFCLNLLMKGKPQGPQTSVDPNLRKAYGELLAGDYYGARNRFRQINSPTEAALRAKTFVELCRTWEDRDDPLRFNWDQASDLIAKVRAMEGLPDDVYKWVKSQDTWVEENKQSYDKLTEAERLAATALERAKEQQYGEALRVFRLAREAFALVKRELTQRAEDRRAGYWASLWKLFVDEIERLMRPQVGATPTDRVPPNWSEALRLIAGLNETELTVSEKQKLAVYEGECRNNVRDEHFFSRARAIIERGNVADHARARDLLQRINKRSDIYPDARAFLGWLEADEFVRRAGEAYARGSMPEANRLLNRARQHETMFGKAASQSITDRQLLWRRVQRAYDGAMKAKGNDAQRAISLFKRVLEEEGDRDNFYHRQAAAELEALERMLTTGLSNKIQRGVTALQSNHYDTALKRFNEIKDDPAANADVLNRIRKAVSDLEASKRLIASAERDYRTLRKENFPIHIEALELLVAWLLPGKKRDEAKDLLEKLK